MKALKKIQQKARARATAARANLDATLLELKNASIDQLKNKIEDTRKRITTETDLAWTVATRVLDKVRSVRESLQKAPSAKAKRSKGPRVKATNAKPKMAKKKQMRATAQVTRQKLAAKKRPSRAASVRA